MLFAISLITFALLSSAGGDALSGLRENPQVSESTIEELRQVYGLDRPFVERYATWATNAIRGDLGESLSFRVDVGSLVWLRFKNTFLMGLLAIAIAVAISFLLAIFVTRYPNRLLDRSVEGLIFLTASTPRMVLALIALVISLRFSLPTGGSGGTATFSLIAGAMVLSVPLVSLMLAQLTGALKEVMAEDYIRLARAKGLSEWAVITRHALRPALDPFLAIAGLSLGALLGGSVIVETVLGWPGIGALMVTAVKARDVPLVMGVLLVASTAVWFGNAVAEMLQAANDPRIGAGDRYR
jgi:peptide/nickel transport system permease protein